MEGRGASEPPRQEKQKKTSPLQLLNHPRARLHLPINQVEAMREHQKRVDREWSSLVFQLAELRLVREIRERGGEPRGGGGAGYWCGGGGCREGGCRDFSCSRRPVHPKQEASEFDSIIDIKEDVLAWERCPSPHIHVHGRGMRRSLLACLAPWTPPPPLGGARSTLNKNARGPTSSRSEQQLPTN